MEKIEWTVQQYDPVTGRCYPVTDGEEEVKVFGVPDGYELPILRMFAERDRRRARCRIVAFQ